MVRVFCLSLAILESVSLANVIWYQRKETSTDGVMLNNAMFVLFSTRIPQKGGINENQNYLIVCATILLVK